MCFYNDVMLGCTRSSLEAYTTVHVMSVLKLTLLMQLLLMSHEFNSPLNVILNGFEMNGKANWNFLMGMGRNI